MIFGFPDVSMTPNTNVIYAWRYQISPNTSRLNTESFWENSFLEISRSVEVQHVGNVGKDGIQRIPKVRLIIFENLEYVINLFQKT